MFLKKAISHFVTYLNDIIIATTTPMATSTATIIIHILILYLFIDTIKKVAYQHTINRCLSLNKSSITVELFPTAASQVTLPRDTMVFISTLLVLWI